VRLCQAVVNEGSICIWLIIQLRDTSSGLPVIIALTPSPCIPLPLQKGKGEELLEEGQSPS